MQHKSNWKNNDKVFRLRSAQSEKVDLDYTTSGGAPYAGPREVLAWDYNT